MAKSTILDRIIASFFSKNSVLATSRRRNVSGASGLPRRNRFLTGAVLTAALLLGAGTLYAQTTYTVGPGQAYETLEQLRQANVVSNGDSITLNISGIDKSLTDFFDFGVDTISISGYGFLTTEVDTRFAQSTGVGGVTNIWAENDKKLTFDGFSDSGFGGVISGLALNFGVAGGAGSLVFSNNSVTGTGTDSGLGGAIYAHKSATLLADGGNILFRGNTQGTEETRKANAVFMFNNGNNDTLNLAATVSQKIKFFDPIDSNDANSNLKIEINNGAAYTGTIVFDGSYWRNKTDDGYTFSEADVTSAVYGTTTVRGGTLALLNGVTYGAADNVGIFRLEDATLLSNATHSNTVQAGTITLDAGSTLAFDMTGAVAIGESGATRNLTLNGITMGINSGTVDLRGIRGLETGKTYNLVLATGIGDTQTLQIYGENLADTRAAGAFSLDNAGGSTLQLTKDTDIPNFVRYWNTDTGTWNATMQNWREDATTGVSNERFFHGDAVVFGAISNHTTGGTVSILAEGVELGTLGGTHPGMEIAGGTWTFTGGEIFGGAIHFSGTGSATFGGVNGGTGRDMHQRVTSATGTTATLIAADGTTLYFDGFSITGHDADSYGGAISSGGNLYFGFAGGTGKMVFSQNSATGDGTNSGLGGAIYANSLRFYGGDYTFSNNSATGGSGNYSGYGGAINTYNTLTFYDGDYTFSNNSATGGGNNSGRGGAIYTGSALLFIAGDYSFTGNSASGTGNYSGHGGAIHTLGYLTFTAGDYSFTDNSASGSGDYSGLGGAIYATYLRFYDGDYTFSNNSATGTGTDSGRGGAIYANNDVTLVADGGNILFRGNTQGTATEHKANALYLNNTGNNTLNLAAKAGQKIEFFDPIESNATRPNLVIDINKPNTLGNSETYDGTVIFDGSHWTEEADRTSIVYGNTTVHVGTLALRNGVTYGAASDVGSFTLSGGANLDPTGATNTVRAATVDFDIASNLNFDLDGAAATVAHLNVNAVTYVNKIGTQNINVTDSGTLVATNPYLLATAAAGEIATTGTVTYNGVLQAAPGRGVTAIGLTTDTELKELYVQNVSMAATGNTLLWRGGNHSWDTVVLNTNWYPLFGDNIIPTEINYVDGEHVVFTDYGESKTVAVADGIAPASVTVNNSVNNDYLFYGGSIASTGKLAKSGTGALSLHAANEFATGISFTGGAILLGDDKSLGTWKQNGNGANTAEGNTAFMNSQGMVTVTGGDAAISVNEGRTITNHFVLGVPDATGLTEDRSGTLTFYINPNATLTIEGVKSTAQSLSLGAGGAINVNVYTSSPDAESPLSFTGGGHLVFEENESYRLGGAVGAFFSVSGQHSVLDFTGLASVTFMKNIAGSTRDGFGGGISSSPTFSSSTSVTLGDAATFTGNIAGYAGLGCGGGIYSSTGIYPSSVTLGATATFTDNIAGYAGYGEGGGIYSYSTSGNSSVTLGDHATFTGNIAGYAGNTATGQGGAIYSQSNPGSDVKIGSYAYLAGNRAGGGNAGGYGGAIYSSHNVTLSGHTLFEGNLVGADVGSDSFGGAIFLNGWGVSCTATLDTGNVATAAIAFRDNKTCVTVTNGTADLDTGTPNSIHLDRDTKLDLKGDGNIYFDDPISSGTTAGLSGGNSLVKSGAGFVQFLGDSRLDTTGFTDTNSVEIQSGTFRLADAATFDASGAGVFHVAGTFAGNGTITATAFTISGTISPDSDRFEIPTFVTKGDPGATAEHYNFFLNDKETSVAAAKRIGTLTLDGAVELDGATLEIDIDHLAGTPAPHDQILVTGAVTFGTNKNTIRLTGAVLGETYDIVTATDIASIADNFNAVLGTSSDGYSLSRTTANLNIGIGVFEQTLQVAFGTVQKNLVLTWTGAETALWTVGTTANANWTDDTDTEKYFKTGDTVTFDSATDSPNSQNREIEVQDAVEVANMTVTGEADYTFTGASITSPAGTLTKSGAGTLTLSGDGSSFKSTIVSAGTLALTQNGTFIATDGIEIKSGGTLRVGNGGTTGNLSGDIVNDGTLVFNRSNALPFENTISGSGTVKMTGTGTLTLSGTNTQANDFIQENGTVNLMKTWTGGYTQTGGTLVGGGEITGNAVFSGTVKPTGTLNVGTVTFDGAVVDFGLLTDENKIIVTGHAEIIGASASIDAAGVSTTESFTLLQFGSMTASGIHATSITNSGENRVDIYVTANALMCDVVVGNTTLYWNGSDGKNAWDGDEINRNWTNGNIDTWFKNGDTVVFDDSATNKTVIVDPNGVSVGLMSVSATGYTFNLTAGNSPGITASGDVDLGNATLNITGYTPDESSPHDAPKNVQTVVSTTGGISNFNPAVTVAGLATTDFLSASAFLDDNDNALKVETRLSWYSTDPKREAHGDFTVDGGNTFTLGAVLDDNDASTNLRADWDGKSLTKKDAGTLILSAENTYTGGTTIIGGTLQIGNGGTKGSVAGDIVNNAALVFDRSDDIAYGGKITGGGTVTKKGAGTLTLSGDSSAYGGTFTQFAGGVHLTGTGKLGGNFVQNPGTPFSSENGATLYNTTFSDTVTPTGTLNASAVILDGASVDFGSAPGTNNIASTGNVVFQNDASTLRLGDLSASPTAEFTLMSSETGTISGLETATVNVTLGDHRGGLYLADSDTKLNYGIVAGNTTLTWTGSSPDWNTTNTNWNTGKFDTYFKSGDDIVFDNHATNKNVSVDGDVSVASMTVTGTGYAFGLTVDAADPSAPSINATGTVDLKDSTLVVDVKNTGSLNKGQSNATRVSVVTGSEVKFDGTATLHSSLSRVKFNPVLGDGFLAYDLWLAGYAGTYADRLSPNGDRMTTLIDRLPGGNGFLDRLDALIDDANVISGIENSTGEGYAMSMQGVTSLQRTFADLIIARKQIKAERCGPCAPTCGKGSNYELWGQFTGGSHDRSSLGRYSGYDLSNYGVAFGIERKISSRWFGGVAFGYDNATLKLDDRAAKDEFEAFRASLYGGYTGRGWYASGYAGYSKNRHDMKRNNYVLGFSNRGKYDDDLFSTGLELGRVLKLHNSNRFIPSIGIHWVHLDTPAFTERGDAASALKLSGSYYDSVRLPLGARLNRSFHTNRNPWSLPLTLTPEIRAFYVAELSDVRSGLYTDFASSPGTGKVFADSGDGGRSGGIFGVGLTAQLATRLSVGVDYDYEVWERYDRHNLRGNVRYCW